MNHFGENLAIVGVSYRHVPVATLGAHALPRQELVTRLPELAASAEVMLLHVRQGEKPASAAFPPNIVAALSAAQLTAEALAARSTGSRKIELRRR